MVKRRTSRSSRAKLTDVATDIRILEARTLLSGVAVEAKDINTTGAGSEPRDLTVVGNSLFFVVSTPTSGDELWKTNGTAAGTVRVKSGFAGDVFGIGYRSLTAVGNTLYFVADDGVHGAELWKSNGTVAGTVLVRDINPGSAGTFGFRFTNVSGTLFFTVNDGTHGEELWKSDGTAAGTVLVKDIMPGVDGAEVSDLTNVNGTLYFTADDGENGKELWKSNGTAAGTVLVKDLNPGLDDSRPRQLTNIKGTLYFTADDGVHGEELWKSDGTSNGTVLVKDTGTGNRGSSPSKFTEFNGTLFFSANDGVNGYELWKSNGTLVGTVLVANIRSGAAGSSPSKLTNVNGTLFFTADDGIHGHELWKSDGTAAGTVLVRDTVAGNDSGPGRYSHSVTNVNGTLYFTDNDGVHGKELWKSDGTAAGTVLVKDIQSGSGESFPYELTNLNGRLFFSADNGTHGNELWASDGTATGTVMVKDIVPGTANGAESYGGFVPIDSFESASVGNTLYFTGSSAPYDVELWKTDGTAVGTVLVKEIAAGDTGSYPRNLTTVNATLFFTANDGVRGMELWKSDGTAAGTVLVKDIRPGTPGATPNSLVNVNGTLYFTANDGVHGEELWKSDGTAAGTLLVKEIRAAANGADPRSLTSLNGVLYFTADDGVHGEELWKSNGTAAGTVLVKDGIPGADGSYPHNLTGVGGTLYFTVNDSGYSTELWKSNGTAAGTVLVASFTVTGYGDAVSSLTNLNGTLYFQAEDELHGRELWKSNGTAAGTVLVKDVRTGSESGLDFAAGFTNLNGKLVFTADNGVNGRELWLSDGTAAGTATIKDINPGTRSAFSARGLPALISANGSVYFTADDGMHGKELWTTNGTAAGTVLVQDIAAGSGASDPGGLQIAGNRLFFAATTEEHGREIWSLGLSAAVPSVQLLAGTTVIPDGTGTFSFGSTRSGVPVSRTFTVRNSGESPLVVQPVSVPAGFTVTSNFTAGQTIAPGGSASFTVRLNASVAGSPGGTLQFLNNDPAPGRSPFNVTVSGTVTPAAGNSAPVIGSFETAVTFKENGPPVVLDTNATVTDADSANFSTGKLTVSVVANLQTTDRIGIRSVGNGAGQIGVSGTKVSYGGLAIGTFAGTTSLVVTLNTNATAAAVQALLRNIKFSSISEAPSTLARTVKVTLTDGDGGTSNLPTKTVNVTAVNDAPVIGLFDTAVTFKENGLPVVLDTNATVTDVDSANFSTGKLTVSVVANLQTTDRIGIRSVGNGAGQIGVSGTKVSYGGLAIGTFAGTTSLVVTLNTNATAVAVQALLRSITFSSVSEAPSTLARTVKVTLTDGDGGTSNLPTKTVNVTAVNDAPVIGLFDTAVTFKENGPPVVLDTNATVTDADSANFSTGKLTVSVVANLQTTDRIGIRSVGNGAGQIGVSGTTVSYGGLPIGTFSGTTSLVVTLNTNATAAAVQALLRNVTFSSVSAAPSILARTVKVTLTDGDGGTSSSPTKTVNVVRGTAGMASRMMAPPLFSDLDDAFGQGLVEVDLMIG